MKKILCLLMLFLCISATSYADTYIAYQYAARVKDSYGWTDWSDRVRCKIYISIDEDNKIIIYSKDTQVYVPYLTEDPYTDDDGGRNLPMLCKDKNRGKCEVRLRI